METITFRCDNTKCHQTLKVKQALAGKKIKCPTCGHKMVVPQKASPEVPAEPEKVVANVSAPAPTLPASPAPLRAKRHQYGIFCPKCMGLLLPPVKDVKHITCHLCGAQIELV